MGIEYLTQKNAATAALCITFLAGLYTKFGGYPHQVSNALFLGSVVSASVFAVFVRDDGRPVSGDERDNITVSRNGSVTESVPSTTGLDDGLGGRQNGAPGSPHHQRRGSASRRSRRLTSRRGDSLENGVAPRGGDSTLPDLVFPLDIVLSQSPLGDSDIGGEEVIPNKKVPIGFENEYVKGRFLMKLRSEPQDPYFASYFEGNQTMFELMLQAQFKQIPPVGHDVYMGMEIPERISLGLVSRAVLKLLANLVKRLVPAIHYSFGSDTELPHCVFPLVRVADRFHRSSPEETPPTLGVSQLCDSVDDKTKRGSLNTRDTFSFSFHSRFMDLVSWRIVNLPGMRDIDLSSLIDRLPIRFVLYDIVGAGRVDGKDVLHESRRKRYYFSLAIQHTGATVKFREPLEDVDEDVGDRSGNRSQVDLSISPLLSPDSETAGETVVPPIELPAAVSVERTPAAALDVATAQRGSSPSGPEKRGETCVDKYTITRTSVVAVVERPKGADYVILIQARKRAGSVMDAGNKQSAVYKEWCVVRTYQDFLHLEQARDSILGLAQGVRKGIRRYTKSDVHESTPLVNVVHPTGSAPSLRPPTSDTIAENPNPPVQATSRFRYFSRGTATEAATSITTAVPSPTASTPPIGRGSTRRDRALRRGVSEDEGKKMIERDQKQSVQEVAGTFMRPRGFSLNSLYHTPSPLPKPLRRQPQAIDINVHRIDIERSLRGIVSALARGCCEETPESTSHKCARVLYKFLDNGTSQRRLHQSLVMAGKKDYNIPSSGYGYPSATELKFEFPALRAQWETTWREEWLCVYNDRLVFSRSGVKKPVLVLPLAEISKSRRMCDDVSPFPGRPCLEIHTIPIVHYICLSSEAQLESLLTILPISRGLVAMPPLVEVHAAYLTRSQHHGIGKRRRLVLNCRTLVFKTRPPLPTAVKKSCFASCPSTTHARCHAGSVVSHLASLLSEIKYPACDVVRGMYEAAWGAQLMASGALSPSPASSAARSRAGSEDNLTSVDGRLRACRDPSPLSRRTPRAVAGSSHSLSQPDAHHQPLSVSAPSHQSYLPAEPSPGSAAGDLGGGKAPAATASPVKRRSLFWGAGSRLRRGGGNPLSAGSVDEERGIHDGESSGAPPDFTMPPDSDSESIPFACEQVASGAPRAARPVLGPTNDKPRSSSIGWIWGGGRGNATSNPTSTVSLRGASQVANGCSGRAATDSIAPDCASARDSPDTWSQGANEVDDIFNDSVQIDATCAVGNGDSTSDAIENQPIPFHHRSRPLAVPCPQDRQSRDSGSFDQVETATSATDTPPLTRPSVPVSQSQPPAPEPSSSPRHTQPQSPPLPPPVAAVSAAALEASTASGGGAEDAQASWSAWVDATICFLDASCDLRDPRCDPTHIHSANEALAFFLNLFHSLLLHSLLLLGPPGTKKGRFALASTVSYEVGGVTLSLADIEHHLLRRGPGLLSFNKIPAKRGRLSLAFSSGVRMLTPARNSLVPTLSPLPISSKTRTVDPRLNFALNLGTFSDPSVIPIFSADDLDRMLSATVTLHLEHSLQVNEPRRIVYLPSISHWCRDDIAHDDGANRLPPRPHNSPPSSSATPGVVGDVPVITSATGTVTTEPTTIARPGLHHTAAKVTASEPQGADPTPSNPHASSTVPLPVNSGGADAVYQATPAPFSSSSSSSPSLPQSPAAASDVPTSDSVGHEAPSHCSASVANSAGQYHPAGATASGGGRGREDLVELLRWLMPYMLKPRRKQVERLLSNSSPPPTVKFVAPAVTFRPWMDLRDVKPEDLTRSHFA
eukprot:Rmarinus@m.11598